MRALGLAGVASLLLLVGGAGAGAAGQAVPAGETGATGDPTIGRRLYETGCSSCHGLEGRGTRLGPPLIGVGAASADFYLSTGRMPLDDPDEEAQRKPPAYSAKEIADLTAYVASLGGGPPIPAVDPDGGELPLGSQTYTANCAACHNSAGSGGALGQAVFAPGVRQATPVQVAEAIRIGPGAMPVFGPETLDDHEVNSVVAYLLFLRHTEDRGGAPLGRLGPVPEGLVAWVVGLGPMLAAAFWIGTRQ
ncbi:MAG: c-type cytochrome [Actinomycetota bacterium]|nr:c-type cytochrome [Actinomycetota bacterium]